MTAPNVSAAAPPVTLGPYVPAAYDPTSLAGKTILQLRAELQSEFARIKAAIPLRQWVDAAESDIPFNTDKDIVPGLRALEKRVADNTKIILPPGVHVANDWQMVARRGIGYYARNLPMPDGGGGATTIISGKSQSGGALLSILSCDHPEIVGIAFQTDQGTRCDVAIDIDQDGVNGVVGTMARIRFNLLRTKAPNSNLVLLRLSGTTNQNQEYDEIDHNTFSGGMGVTLLTDVTIDIANPQTLVSKAGKLTKDHDQLRIRIPNAGRTPDGKPGALDCIVGYVDANHGHLSVAASFAVDKDPSNPDPVAGERAIIGETVGQGLTNAIGSKSANAKMMDIHRNYFNNLERGWWFANGSVFAEQNSYTGNEVNIEIDDASESIELTAENTEASRQHLVYAPGQSLRVKSNRLGMTYVKPNDGMLRLLGGKIELLGTHVDAAPIPKGSYVFNAAGGHVRLRTRNTTFGYAPTVAEVGYGTVTSYWVDSDGDGPFADWPYASFRLHGWGQDKVAKAVIILPGAGDMVSVEHQGRVLNGMPSGKPDDALLAPGMSTDYYEPADGHTYRRMRLTDGTLGMLDLGPVRKDTGS